MLCGQSRPMLSCFTLPGRRCNHVPCVQHKTHVLRPAACCSAELHETIALRHRKSVRRRMLPPQRQGLSSNHAGHVERGQGPLKAVSPYSAYAAPQERNKYFATSVLAVKRRLWRHRKSSAAAGPVRRVPAKHLQRAPAHRTNAAHAMHLLERSACVQGTRCRRAGTGGLAQARRCRWNAASGLSPQFTLICKHACSKLWPRRRARPACC